jgi:hypothetical protein
MIRKFIIWSVQWVETDETGINRPIVEIHLNYNSAMSKAVEIVNITTDEYIAMRGYPARITSDISMTEIEIK